MPPLLWRALPGNAHHSLLRSMVQLDALGSADYPHHCLYQYCGP